MIYVGIDPGANGAIAVIRGDDIDVCELKKYTPKDVIEWMRNQLCLDDAVAYIERVSAMPGQGVSSTFKFGQSFGWILGVLDSIGIRYELVTPTTWKRQLKCLATKGTSKTAIKNIDKAACQRLFPTERTGIKVTHAVADAMLIAEYARRKK